MDKEQILTRITENFLGDAMMKKGEEIREIISIYKQALKEKVLNDAKNFSQKSK